jgi:hypothetical protein
MDENDDELLESWFARGELAELSEAPLYEEESDRRSRVGVVVAAVSAAALTLLIVLAGRV